MSTVGESGETNLKIPFVVALSVISVLPFLVLPSLIGAMANDLVLSEKQVGFVSSAIIVGISLSAILSLFWVRKVNWRLVGWAALAMMIASHILSLFTESILILGILQGIASLGGGAVYSLMLTHFSDQDNADRYFGYSVAAQVTTQMFGLLLLPSLIIKDGMDAVFLLFIFFESVALFLILALPKCGKKVTESSALSAIFRLQPFLALLGCFFFFFNVGVFWTYIQRIALASGLIEQSIGYGLSLAVGIGILGAVVAAWQGDRFGRLKPLTFAAFATVAATIFIRPDMSFLTMVVAVALYKFCWNYSLTYQYAFINYVDTSGKSVAGTPAFHGAGGALGPSVAALFVTSTDYSIANYLVIGSILISLCFFYLSNISMAENAQKRGRKVPD